MADDILPPRDCYVYILYRKDGVTPFYVGKGHGWRWNAHVWMAKRGERRNVHKDNIIRGMLSRGLDIPKRKVAEGLTDQQAYDLEQELIKFVGCWFEGGLLTNTHAGKGGTRRGQAHTPATRKKMSEAQLGKVRSPEHQANLSAALKGRECTEETRQKLSVSGKGKKRSEEFKRALSDARRGKSRSEEVKLAMRRGWAKRLARLGNQQDLFDT